jgi:hypothetical protein
MDRKMQRHACRSLSQFLIRISNDTKKEQIQAALHPLFTPLRAALLLQGKQKSG